MRLVFTSACLQDYHRRLLLDKINSDLKIFVKVSNFPLKVNSSIFQKTLVTYATPSIYCSSFYCRIQFYYVVDMVFLNALFKRF